MKQTAQSYLVICIFNNFLKLFEDFVDTCILGICMNQEINNDNSFVSRI
jgi:hypothetical protein